MVSVLSARRMERLVVLRTDKVALVSTRALVTSFPIVRSVSPEELVRSMGQWRGRGGEIPF